MAQPEPAPPLSETPLAVTLVIAPSFSFVSLALCLDGLRIAEVALAKDLYAILPVDLPETAPAARFDRFLAEGAPD